ncbi:MAG: molecular chaperone HtpG [Deltaproteobacteria bacterium]|nr:molecular chaperone HtpG [Deltaproteobacteria bacterium]
MSAVETHRFEAEVNQVLRLVIHSLYSNPEVFLRELVSNASDALDKLRFAALTEPALDDGQPRRIRVSVDNEAGTITIADAGIGMSHDDLKKNLGTVAHSGSRALLSALEQAGGKGGLNLIGQFGVGFYAAFLVADDVTVVSRAAGSSEAWRWSASMAGGDGGAAGQFTLEPATRDGAGTDVILHVRDDKKEFLSTWKLKDLIVRYSDYIAHPIELRVERWQKPEEGQAPATSPTFEWEQVNRAKALWQRAPGEVPAEEYAEFYKHLTHDWEPPLGHIHFKVEGQKVFDGILFAPKRPPVDLYAWEQGHGVRLYVKRVFIMDEVKELLPMFLRFVRGVVDSDDLPLNVSRELLQDSALVRFIQKQVTKKALDMLERLATDKPLDYVAFWRGFGAVLKEGLHTAPEHRDRIAKLCRFRSTRTVDLDAASAEGWVSLADYKARMVQADPGDESKKAQKAIYYVIAENERAAARSPHLEALVSRGYEVLFLTDPIDEWAVEGLGNFEEVPLVSAMKADLGLDPVEVPGAKDLPSDARAVAQALMLRFTEVLGDRVAEVRESSRLTTSPVCLVVPEGGVHAHIERMLKATQPNFQGNKRILEVNTQHPMIQNLARIAEKAPSHAELASWIEVLYAQALLSEGNRLEDPSAFVDQITHLLTGATARAASDLG